MRYLESLKVTWEQPNMTLKQLRYSYLGTYQYVCANTAATSITNHNLGVCFLPSLVDRFSNHGSDEHDLQQDELGLGWWGSTADEVPFAANDQSRLKVQMRALRP